MGNWREWLCWYTAIVREKGNIVLLAELKRRFQGCKARLPRGTPVTTAAYKVPSFSALHPVELRCAACFEASHFELHITGCSRIFVVAAQRSREEERLQCQCPFIRKTAGSSRPKVSKPWTLLSCATIDCCQPRFGQGPSHTFPVA